MNTKCCLVGCVVVLGGHVLAASPSEHVEQLCREGSHVEAESVASEAVAEQRRKNPRHPNCATSLHNLAMVYVARGRSAEAELLYRQALEIDEEAGESAHADKAITLSSLAALAREQGRLDEAERLLRQALKIRERLQGPDHHWTAAVLTNLAATFESQGRKDEAKHTHEQAVAIFQKAFSLAGVRPDKSLEPVPVFRRERAD